MSQESLKSDADYRSRLQAELSWRMQPGILGKHSSSQQSVHTLLGYFLADRDSPSPFPGRA